MKTIHIVYWFDESDGIDFEAVFDGETLLECWSTNDATWHSETNDSWLEKVGIKIAYREPTESDKAAIRKQFGIES